MFEKITIYDIAAKLNISAATVSRALNKNPKISKNTQKLVQETAERMQYKQNKLALALKSGKSNSVGVLVPHINRNFFSTIIRGIEDELNPHGYHVIICQSYNNESKEIENINALLNAQVDGILMSTSMVKNSFDEFANRIIKKGIPLIFFDRKRDIEGVSSVTINDYDGGYQATKHLIEQGCKRIAHFSVNRSMEIYRERFNGYKQALADYGLKLNESYVIKASNKVEGGIEAARKLLKLKTLPDALFSASDFLALGAIQVFKDMGIKIPEEICVVGFSNEPFTEFMELSISSVDQFPLDMGKIAAKVFLDMVKDGGKVKRENKVVLAPKLLIRRSSTKK